MAAAPSTAQRTAGAFGSVVRGGAGSDRALSTDPWVNSESATVVPVNSEPVTARPGSMCPRPAGDGSAAAG